MLRNKKKTLKNQVHLKNYKHLARTSQKTHKVSATKLSRLMLLGQKVAVYCKTHTEHTNTLCGQNAETVYVRILSVPQRKLITSPIQSPTG
jgi:hypothetical protein